MGARVVLQTVTSSYKLLTVKLTFLIMRAFVPLWLCLGTHLHIALEHASEQNHALEHASQTQRDIAEYLADSPQPISDSGLTPFHHHHDDSTPHSHEINAVRSLSQTRDAQSHASVPAPASLQQPIPVISAAAPFGRLHFSLDPPSLRIQAPRAPPYA